MPRRAATRLRASARTAKTRAYKSRTTARASRGQTSARVGSKGRNTRTTKNKSMRALRRRSAHSRGGDQDLTTLAVFPQQQGLIALDKNSDQTIPSATIVAYGKHRNGNYALPEPEGTQRQVRISFAHTPADGRYYVNIDRKYYEITSEITFGEEAGSSFMNMTLIKPNKKTRELVISLNNEAAFYFLDMLISSNLSLSQDFENSIRLITSLNDRRNGMAGGVHRHHVIRYLMKKIGLFLSEKNKYKITYDYTPKVRFNIGFADDDTRYQVQAI